MIRNYQRAGPAAFCRETMSNIESGRSRFHQLDPWKAEHFR
jgi:hypothetical protein